MSWIFYDCPELGRLNRQVVIMDTTGNKPKRGIYFVGVIFIILAVAFGAMHPQFAPIKADLDAPKIMGVVGGFFVLVLLIERTAEIFITILRGSEAEGLKEKISELAKEIEKAELVIKAMPAGSTAALEAANKEAKQKQDELRKNKAELVTNQSDTKYKALLMSFFLSAIVCAGGVGILNTIVEIDPGRVCVNYLRGIDIVLTAGLLAGGSDAFHQFVRALETIFANIKNK